MKEPGKEVVIGGLFGALGIALPWVFHLIPNAGPTLLPMHLPVVTVGFLVSPAVAASVGLLTPLLSMFLTAMPPLHLGPLMSVELAVLAGSASIFYRRLRWPLYLSLVLAIVLARATMAVLMGAMLLWLAPALGLSAKAYGFGFILTGLPGTALQLLVVPLVVRAVEREETPGG